jgi:transcriptional regulator with XRE-family HTH domain
MQSDSPIPFTPSELARAMGISRPFASQVLTGARSMPRKLAIRIYRWKGVKLGPIEDATHQEIETLERFEARGA